MKIITKIGEYTIQKEEWGLIHVGNPPSNEELDRIYAEEYYSSDKPDYISKYEEDEEWWTEVYKYRLNLMSRYNPSNKILTDIGSGPGLLLETANKMGWTSKGYEPNKDAFNYSHEKGLNVINDFFHGQENELQHIYLGEVLEHIKNPVSFMNDIVKCMSKGAVIAILVPNDVSLIQKLLTNTLGYKEWFYAPPYHLNYFNVNSLQKLIEIVGLETIHVETTFSIETMLMLGENYLKDSSIGRHWHKRRMQWEIETLRKNPDIYEEYYTRMGKIGHGREILLIAKK